MAVGFTPKYVKNFALDGLTQEQFLVIAFEAAVAKKWNIAYVSDSGLVAYTNNGMFSQNAEIRIWMAGDGDANIKSSSVGSEMMDFGKNKKNAFSYLATFNNIKSTLTPEEITAKYQNLVLNYIAEEDIFKLPPAKTKDHIKDFFSFFIPTKDFFITPILIDLNILIFILMAISGVSIMAPDSGSLLKWGANFRPMTLEGEWWRLLTCCFIHIGIFHLLMNMYALLYIGTLLEPILGRTRFMSAYLLAGISSSVVSLWWNDLTISAGASGAIFGMYGVFLALLTTNLIEKNARKSLLTSIAIFVGYNLIYGLKDGIDNAAHIGGLLSGLIIGYSFVPGLMKPQNKKLKYGAISLLAVFILFSSFMVVKRIPNDYSIYDAKMERFALLEKRALNVFRLPQDTPATEIFTEFGDSGVYYWKECVLLIDSLKYLNLPSGIITKNELLMEYCELRIKSYNLIYKAMSENTDKYKSEIDECNEQIMEKINQLGGYHE